MGEIKKGILGGFSGTVGTVVGSNWRGKDIIKSRPTASGKMPTPKQMEQRVKFGAAVKFLAPLKAVQGTYFGAPQGSRSRVNLATSYHLTEAVQVVGGIPQLVFNKVLVTKGELAGFQNPTVTPGTGQTLLFEWEDNSAQGKAAPTDVFECAVYCAEVKQFVVLSSGNTRDEGVGSVQLPTALAGRQVQVYGYFRNMEETAACTSLYLGAVMVS